METTEKNKKKWGQIQLISILHFVVFSFTAKGQKRIKKKKKKIGYLPPPPKQQASSLGASAKHGTFVRRCIDMDMWKINLNIPRGPS